MQTIYIGKETTVTVLGVNGDEVRVGIDAPREIVIDRAEVHERKRRAALGLAGVQPSADSSASPTGDVTEQAGSACRPASSGIKVTRKRRVGARNPRTNRIEFEVTLRAAGDVRKDEGS